MSKKLLNKLPSHLTTEELLSSLEKAKEDVPEEKDEYITYSSNVAEFLACFKIDRGGVPIRGQLLYNIYCQYTSERVTKQVFGRECLKYLFQRQIGPHLYFLINIQNSTLINTLTKLKNRGKRDKRKSAAFRKHFESFLKHYNITEGNTFVPGYALFYLYDKWCYKINKRHQFSDKTFHQFCTVYFLSKRTGNSRGLSFGVSNIQDVISEKEIEEIKKARERKK